MKQRLMPLLYIMTPTNKCLLHTVIAKDIFRLLLYFHLAQCLGSNVHRFEQIEKWERISLCRNVKLALLQIIVCVFADSFFCLMADELERYEDMQKLCYWNHSWTVCLAACWTCHCTWLLLLCYSSHSAFEGSFRSGCIEKLCFWKVFIPIFNLKLLVLMRHGNKDSNSL